MKRVKAACICQTIHFMLKEDAVHDYAVKLVNEEIEKYAKGWSLKRISKIALSIMRCALCEMQYMADVPEKVAINEAVNLAKKYEEPETVSFSNGVLGGFVRAKQENA